MPPEAAPLLKADGVDAGYGSMQVLWGVDLDVRAGETVLLLGANGAGKTTFLKSLVGLVEARHGSINLGGEDVTRMRSSERMRLGMMGGGEGARWHRIDHQYELVAGARFRDFARAMVRKRRRAASGAASSTKRRPPPSRGRATPSCGDGS